MAITIWDIVADTGLSQPAVSQILNGKGRFRPETRERVIAAANRLGWRPNSSARAMTTGRFNAVALVLSDKLVTSILPGGLLAGIDTALVRLGYHLVIARLPDERLTDAEHAPKLLSHMMVDGLLVNYNAHIPDGFADIIASTGLPAVWINSQQAAASVYPDDRAGAAAATRHLLALGHRRIAFLDYNKGPSEPAFHYSFAERREGYGEMMRQAGLAPRFLGRDGGVLPPHRQEFTRSWMEQADRPTAVLCYSGELVETLRLTAALLGLDVPRDLSLAIFAHGPVTSVDLGIDHALIDSSAIAAAAVDMVMTMTAQHSTLPNRAIAMPYVAAGSVVPPR